MMVQGINRKINYKVKKEPRGCRRMDQGGDTHDAIIPRISLTAYKSFAIGHKNGSGEDMVDVFSGLVRCGI